MLSTSELSIQRRQLSIQITSYMLKGTFVVATILSVLLLIYQHNGGSAMLAGRVWAICSGFSLLVCAAVLFKRRHYRSVNWLIIIFYLLTSLYALLVWGLDEPIALLAICFAVILPGILIGGKAIPLVTLIAILNLVFVQYIHTFTFIAPYAQPAALLSRELDIVTYAVILLILASISWLSEEHREKIIQRALTAEAKLRAQKNALSTELQEESSALRLAELSEIRQFHKFALLGQSTAAVLHELSNHLSVLNLDIDDLRQQVKNKKAIANAEESINQINKMVRDARQQLNTYDEHVHFNAVQTINRIINDFQIKYTSSAITIKKSYRLTHKSYPVIGSPLALMQIITVLLGNAVDACRHSPRPEITISLKSSPTSLEIKIKDNGPGIDPSVEKSLFNPMTSTKSTGLGVGLYIARHLAQAQFGGSVNAAPDTSGATFIVTIPKRAS